MSGWIDRVISEGDIATAIVLLLVLEGGAIVWIRRRTGRGIALSKLLPSLLAGAGLALALRAALTGAPVMVMALWLAIALVAHLWDLMARWEAGSGARAAERL